MLSDWYWLWLLDSQNMEEKTSIFIGRVIKKYLKEDKDCVKLNITSKDDKYHNRVKYWMNSEQQNSFPQF